MHATVRVPGSTSNLGAGFDSVGAAVDRWLTVTARISEGKPGVALSRSGTLSALSHDAHNDRLVIGFRAACARADVSCPERLELEASSTIPVGRGLGSSAAAIVAGAVLGRVLLRLPLSEEDLLDICANVEGHPDNAAAAIAGGVVLVVRGSGGRRSVAPLALHDSLAFVFAIPEFEVRTSDARAVLPSELPYATAVTAAARAAALVHGLATADPNMLAAGLDDVLHVPARRHLLPGFDDVVRAARTAGAYGATLSGSGSTLVAVCGVARSGAVLDSMLSAWRGTGVRTHGFCSDGPTTGYVLEHSPGPATKRLSAPADGADS